jgi:hypothetical protein
MSTFENEFTEALNTQNFNYNTDLTEMEEFVRNYYLTNYNYTLISIKIIDNENGSRKLIIYYSAPDGGESANTFTINYFN